MRGASHACIGLTTVLLVLRPDPSSLILCSGYALLGSLVPDIDTQYGTIRKPAAIASLLSLLSYNFLLSAQKTFAAIGIVLFLIALIKASTYSHRDKTHSLVALVLVSIPLMLISTNIMVPFFIGYFMHLYADSFTKMGVPFFLPFNSNKYGFKLIKTNGVAESITTLATLFILFKFLATYYTTNELTQSLINFITPLIKFVEVYF